MRPNVETKGSNVVPLAPLDPEGRRKAALRRFVTPVVRLIDMKWFTREWQTGELSDRHWDSVEQSYRDHIAELRPSLPEGLTRLAEGGGQLSLHDGWFIDGLQPWKTEEILFDIRCWDMAQGRLIDNVWIYPMLHVRIVYQQAKLIHPEWPVFKANRSSPSQEILYGELDRAENDRFEHRMLLWPKSCGHVAVQFASAELVVVRFDGATAEVVDTTGS